MNYKIIGGDRKEYGPASVEELRRWAEEGRLNSQSLARADEPGSEWEPMASIPELAELFVGQPTPPPLPGAAAAPIDPRALAAQLLARPQTIAIGSCLARAGSLLGRNFGLLVGACLLVWLLSLAEFVPLVGLLYHIIAGPLFGGLYLLYLKRIRGQPGRVSDTLSGFSDWFGQLALAGFVSWILTQLGFAFCTLPGLYLVVAWSFCVPLAADRQLEFWSAMELSRKVASRVWFPLAVLLLIAFLPVIAVILFGKAKLVLFFVSALPSLVHNGQPDMGRIREFFTEMDKVAWPLMLLIKGVWLFNLPFGVGALMYAYEDLFGPRRTPPP
jgi:GYF domain 2